MSDQEKAEAVVAEMNAAEELADLRARLAEVEAERDELLAARNERIAGYIGAELITSLGLGEGPRPTGWRAAYLAAQERDIALARANLAETKLSALETLLLHPPAGASDAEVLAGAGGWLRLAAGAEEKG